MAALHDDIIGHVEQLKGHVSERDYKEALETLKALGGEVGAFAAMHAALCGVGLAGSVAVGWTVGATAPVFAVPLFIAGMTGVLAAYLYVAKLLNEWYDTLDSDSRIALTKVLAFGIQHRRVLGKGWKLLAR